MFVSDKVDNAMIKITLDFDPETGSFQLIEENGALELYCNKHHISRPELAFLMGICKVNDYYADRYIEFIDETYYMTNNPAFYRHWCKAVIDISFTYLYTKVENFYSSQGLKGKKLENKCIKVVFDAYNKFVDGEDEWYIFS
jgi:hypothetical protein